MMTKQLIGLIFLSIVYPKQVNAGLDIVPGKWFSVSETTDPDGEKSNPTILLEKVMQKLTKEQKKKLEEENQKKGNSKRIYQNGGTFFCLTAEMINSDLSLVEKKKLEGCEVLRYEKGENKLKIGFTCKNETLGGSVLKIKNPRSMELVTQYVDKDQKKTTIWVESIFWSDVCDL